MEADHLTTWLGMERPSELTPTLTENERQALAKLIEQQQTPRRICWANWRLRLGRLINPFDLVYNWVGGDQHQYWLARSFLLREMHQRQTPWWTWSEGEWCEILCSSNASFCQRYSIKEGHRASGRQLLLTCAYLPGNFGAFANIGHFVQLQFAHRVLGKVPIQTALKTVIGEMKQMGMSQSLTEVSLTPVLAYALLLARSPHLSDLSTTLLKRVYREVAPSLRRCCLSLSRALCRLGILNQPITRSYAPTRLQDGLGDTVSSEWLSWCERWRATSTEAPQTRAHKFCSLLQTGRWLATHHPEIISPAQWTRDLAAQWVAEVDRMVVGDWLQTKKYLPARSLGKPLMPNTKATLLAQLRTFFIDCQQWGWIPARFDPRRSIITPRSVRILRGPKPRVIADDVWAKLMSAGLTLTEADQPRFANQVQPWYPFALVRALTLTWLFGGLRANEIQRLRLGCIRWQAPHRSAAMSQPPERPVCLLEVPVNKTGTAFVKPVDWLVGEAINAWEQVRPEAVPGWDLKTGESVQFLFVFRGNRVGLQYINKAIIPMLCHKAGVPQADAQGAITSHRARSTIATQLYNADDPMSLFELQAWLGHQSPESTQHYAKIMPTKLAKAYQDAGYFDRNTRMVELLVDEGAILSGGAANGKPWKYYDLGHGYCTYNFFSQCSHRMACAKCSFYRPKESAESQLLEGKAHLQRMLQAIPLLDDERAAVEDTVGAMDALLQRLTDISTPDKERSTLTPLPIIDRQTVNKLRQP